ncbi:MAG: 2-oxo acid dehydrogenase subunit E2 [Betaproteobacteria bacterium]|nr:2-oxo acid dehydrogenase subunit E2 [Betaproteobacteria bacterium]
MTAVIMPALSPTMETGTLAKWHVKVGDAVKAGDVIAEIETEKATMELEAADDGIVAEILVADGAEDIAVGEVILRLAAEGEAIPPALVPASESESKPEPAPSPAPTSALPSGPLSERGSTPPPVPLASHVDATPLGRKLSLVLGVDLAELAKRQAGRQVTLADLRRAAGLHPAQPAAPPPVPAAPTTSTTTTLPVTAPEAAAAPAPSAMDAPFEVERLTNMRKTIARRLTESKQQVPHFYLTVDVLLDPLLALRAELNAALAADGGKLSVNDMLLKAQAITLMQVPDANVSLAADVIRRYQRADISVAVAVPGGLITPVIRDAASKSLSAIAAEMKDLAARAKEGKLQPAEYTGGTASLSNLGMFGIKQFDAVINPPEAMILAIGAGERRAHVVDDAVTVATVASVTGSFDHRVIDGAVGAAFMAAFKTLVENPWRMLA